MKKMPKVSIVLPLKNAERYLAEAMDGILGQTFGDWELIIVCGRSEDQTWEMANSYKSEKIKILNQGDGNMANAKNIGLRHAKGEYVIEAAGDDVWLPGMLEASVGFMEAHPEVGASYSDYYQIDGRGREIGKVVCQNFDSELPIADRINMGTLVMRRCCVDEVGGYDESLETSEDSALKLELARGFGLARIPQPLIKYRVHPQQSTQARMTEHLRNYDLVKRKFRSRLDKPAVSVVVPAHNAERYITLCIDSIMGQFTPNFEIIVVDDGSTDGTKEICEGYGDQIRNFRREQNLGIARTRNEGIESARGKWICFVSADDMLLPHALETFVRRAKEDAEDCFYFSSYHLIGEQGGAMGSNIVPEMPYEDLVIRSVQSARENRMFLTYNVFAPTGLWRENPFDESYRFGEDLEHILRVMLVKRIKVRVIQQSLYLYRIHPQMATQALGWQRIAENNRRTFQKINGLLGRRVL